MSNSDWKKLAAAAGTVAAIATIVKIVASLLGGR
jgi:hypothetical protein